MPIGDHFGVFSNSKEADKGTLLGYRLKGKPLIVQDEYISSKIFVSLICINDASVMQKI